MGLVVDDSRALAATPYHANFAVVPNPRRGIAVGGLGQPAAGRADAGDRGGEHELRRASRPHRTVGAVLCLSYV